MKPRRYGQWAGDKIGKAEDKTRCIETVYNSFCIGRQCSRKRGYGENFLYCKQHSKKK